MDLPNTNNISELTSCTATDRQSEGGVALQEEHNTDATSVYCGNRFSRWLFFGLPLLAGCANPGPPRPPSLHLPKPAERIDAERVGDRVHLTWTTPAHTTDGGSPRGPLTVVICRDDAPKPPPPVLTYPMPPDPCKPVFHAGVVPGASEATDTLPPALTTGPPSLIAYRIEIFNDRGRTLGPSAPVYAAAGRAPRPAGPLHFVPRRNGVLITWQKDTESSTGQMLLTRTLVADVSGPVSAKPAKRSGTRPASSQEKTATAQQVTLSSESSTGSSSGDTGGMIDRGIKDGDTLTYVAQRVLKVRLATPPSIATGKDGNPRQIQGSVETLELRGEPSPPATCVFHDTLPPDAPTGLAAIPGGGFGQPPAIDLSWNANPELNVQGYNVYRAEAGSAKFALLTVAPTPGPAYRDVSAKQGKTYEYSVTAIDGHGNESSPSLSVSARLNP
jgi:hypothetical protein